MNNTTVVADDVKQNGHYQGPIQPGIIPINEPLLSPNQQIEVNPVTPAATAAEKNDEREKVEKLSITEKFLKSVLTSKSLTTLEVLDRPPTVADWFQAGDIGFIFANRGTGKTWFAMQLARAISYGDNFGAWEVHSAQKVLYIDGEVNLKDTKKRNFALSIDSENFLYLHHEHLYQTTHLTMDIADGEQQSAFLELCQNLEAKVVVLDNLSCLAPTVDENDSFGFSNELLNFTLNMRRNGISLVFVQHAGRKGQMRGHSRREDAANWIIKLEEAKESESVAGAKFRSVFVKNRNAPRTPTSYEWHCFPDGDRTTVAVREMDNLAMFRHCIEAGVTNNKEIAEELGMEAPAVSKLAKRAMNEGWLDKEGRCGGYKLIGGKPGKGIKAAKKPEAPDWIYEVTDVLCTVTDLPGGKTAVTCPVSNQTFEGSEAGPGKHPDMTLAAGLVHLNKSCPCKQEHYVE
jgi:hypothetical protein